MLFTSPDFVFSTLFSFVVQALGHVSGAHINPAVTAGMLAVGNISIIKGICYVIVQCLGALAGSAVLKVRHKYGGNVEEFASCLCKQVDPF